MSKLQFNYKGKRYTYEEHFGEPLRELSKPGIREIFVTREDKSDQRMYLQYDRAMRDQMSLRDWLDWCAIQYEHMISEFSL